MSCKTSKKKRTLKILVSVLVVLVLIFLYFHLYVYPQIVAINVAKIKSNTIEVLNSATSKTISGNDYSNLITILKDDDGNITMLSVNAQNVNKLNNDIMTEIQEVLSNRTVLDYNIPIGQFSGLPLLSGIGPNVSIKVLPIGNVNTAYKSQIASLSINQSYHKIYLTLKIEICIVLPLYTQNIEVSNQLLVAENIIVGKIPSTYLNTDNLTNALNLIP